METSGPGAVDLSKESDATKALYGLTDESPYTKDYGSQLLKARRALRDQLIEHKRQQKKYAS